MTFERRQGRHDANHGVLLFTPLDCGLVKYYIVAEGRTRKRKVLDTKTIVHERRKNGAINKTKRVHGKGKSGWILCCKAGERTLHQWIYRRGFIPFHYKGLIRNH